MSGYFYTVEDVDQFQFYRIPKLLITDEKYKAVSTDAKMLYGLMLDRLSLSIKNNWHDKNGKIYIIYTLNEIMEDLCCQKEKSVKLLTELVKVGLIEKQRQGCGQPSLIYVLKFVTDKKFENRTSRSSKIEP